MQQQGSLLLHEYGVDGFDGGHKALVRFRTISEEFVSGFDAAI